MTTILCMLTLLRLIEPRPGRVVLIKKLFRLNLSGSGGQIAF
jgi:hypothetical protein